MREMVEGPAKLTNPSESLLIIYKQGGHQHQTQALRRYDYYDYHTDRN